MLNHGSVRFEALLRSLENLTRSSLIDSPQKSEGVHGAVDWLGKTVVHPLVNAALIEPYNTLSHAVEDGSGKRLSAGEIDPLKTKQAEAYSTDWFVSSVASGVGSLVPFLISGKLAGSALKGVTAYAGIEGKAASILTSNRLALLSGAGTYAALKRPLEGETRLGNAVGTVAAFAIFDAGNTIASLSKFNNSFATRSALRLATGFLGGATQVEASSLVSQNKHANKDLLIQSGVAGASLNFSMGYLHDTVSGGKTAKPEPTTRDNSRGLFAPEGEQATPARKTRVVPETKPDGNVVYIIVDSGFSPDSLPPRQNILRTWDLTGEGVFNDPLQHGSVILGKLRDADPGAKFMLIKAYDSANNLAQTAFEHGQIARPGWTEAYLEAVKIARQQNLPSVANCSFGEFTHAMDGTGWESFQLSHAIGKNKPGHVVVAAAGPGNGAARHASGLIEAGKTSEVNISQNGEAAFNILMGKDAPKDWTLSVFEGSRKIHTVDGTKLNANFWNNRQQLTFRSHIQDAAARIVLSRHGADARPLPFEFFVQEGKAKFLDHVNPELISEPAIFPDVVAVGIKDLSYSPKQGQPGFKPDVLLLGEGPVSFRTPEVTLAIGQMLKKNPQLDAKQIQSLLQK